MFSPESKTFLQAPGKVQMPSLPGLQQPSGGDHMNPFSGIRRASQAKREQSFAKFNQRHESPTGGEPGAQAGTLFGSMQQKS